MVFKEVDCKNINCLTPEFLAFRKEFLKLQQQSEHVLLDESRHLSDLFFTIPLQKRTPIYSTEDLKIQSSSSQISIRLYKPMPRDNLPVVVFYHGGGWVFGNIEMYDELVRKLAALSSCLFVSVEYRTAPESPFPQPLNDCFEAFKWVSDNISTYGGNSKRILVCGDSAGGNLAGGVSQLALRSGISLCGQVLLYPVIQVDSTEDTYPDSPDDFFLVPKLMAQFRDLYLPNWQDRLNPLVSLNRMDLAEYSGKTFPQTLVITCEYDRLKAEGIRYVERLKGAGYSVAHIDIPKAIHGFLTIPFDFPLKIEVLQKICAIMRSMVNV